MQNKYNLTMNDFHKVLSGEIRAYIKDLRIFIYLKNNKFYAYSNPRKTPIINAGRTPDNCPEWSEKLLKSFENLDQVNEWLNN